MLERRDVPDMTFGASFPPKAFPDAEKLQIPELNATHKAEAKRLRH